MKIVTRDGTLRRTPGGAGELLIRARARDEHAWEEITDIARPVVYEASRRYGQWEEREDLLQGTLLILLSHIGACRAEAPLSHWIARLSVEHVRRASRVRRAEYHPHALAARLAGHGSRASREPTANTTELLWLALSCLSCEHWDVVMLRCIADLSVSRTSGILGVAEGTVKSRLHRALGDLRVVLAFLGSSSLVEAAGVARADPFTVRRRADRAVQQLRGRVTAEWCRVLRSRAAGARVAAPCMSRPAAVPSMHAGA